MNPEQTWEELQRRAIPPPSTDVASGNGGSAPVAPIDQGNATRLVTPVSEIEEGFVEWLWRGRIPQRTVSLLVGVGGLGKSQISLLIASELTRGSLTGRPERVVIFSAEDDPQAVLKPRLRALDANQELVYILKVDADLWLPDGMAQLEEMVRGLGVRLVIFDPLVAYLQEDWDTHKDQHVRGILRGLQQVATTCDATMLAVMHFKKGTEQDALYRVSGSVGFGNAARSVLAASEDPADEQRYVLMHVKTNYGVHQPALRYHIEQFTYPLHGRTQTTSRVVFDGEDSELTVRGVFSREPGPEPERLEEAKAFLFAYLAKGAAPAVEVKKAARTAGISEKTLQRAKGALAVVQIQVRDPATGHITGWTWQLPPAAGTGS